MPQFLIERVMPGVAQLDIDDLKQTSRAGHKKRVSRPGHACYSRIA